MADLKTNMANAWESTLSSALAANATTINVTDTTGSPAVPFYVVIDPGNDAKREVVLVDSSKTSTTFVLSAATKRGQDGTSDVSHDSGAVIAIVTVAAWFTDLHDRVDGKATDANVVHLAGAETITGAKTFSVDPTLADGSSALSLTEGNAAYEAKGDAGVLATLRYAPAGGTVAAYSTTSATTVAIDSTNLKATFTVPSSGSVVIWVTGAFKGTSGAISLAMLNLTAGTSQAAMVFANGETSTFIVKTVPVLVTGMTPGASETVHLGWYTNESAGTAELKVDETSGAADDFGPVHMIVEAA
jgi:hypothetical protein